MYILPTIGHYSLSLSSLGCSVSFANPEPQDTFCQPMNFIIFANPGKLFFFYPGPQDTFCWPCKSYLLFGRFGPVGILCTSMYPLLNWNTLIYLYSLVYFTLKGISMFQKIFLVMKIIFFLTFLASYHFRKMRLPGQRKVRWGSRRSVLGVKKKCINFLQFFSWIHHIHLALKRPYIEHNMCLYKISIKKYIVGKTILFKVD